MSWCALDLLSEGRWWLAAIGRGWRESSSLGDIHPADCASGIEQKFGGAGDVVFVGPGPGAASRSV